MITKTASQKKSTKTATQAISSKKKSSPAPPLQVITVLHDEGGGLIRTRVPTTIVRDLGGRDRDEVVFTKQGRGEWSLRLRPQKESRKSASKKS